MEENLEPKGICKLNKRCFIITPIGNSSDDIRRHTDGIIDAVLEPVLTEFEYRLIVAHRINKTGSINKQVINGIYDADLIIANLTGLNANVMYELAFAHSIGKPTIMIAEDGVTKLPFDISTERTIFCKNDFKGTIELKNLLIDVLTELHKSGEKEDIIDNPIYSWLNTSIYEKTIVNKLKSNGINNDIDAFEYILQRLDNIEYNNVTKNKEVKANPVRSRSYIVDFDEHETKEDALFIKEEFEKRLQDYKSNIRLNSMNYDAEKRCAEYVIKFRRLVGDEVDKVIFPIVDEFVKLNNERNKSYS